MAKESRKGRIYGVRPRFEIPLRDNYGVTFDFVKFQLMRISDLPHGRYLHKIIRPEILIAVQEKMTAAKNEKKEKKARKIAKAKRHHK